VRPSAGNVASIGKLRRSVGAAVAALGRQQQRHGHRQDRGEPAASGRSTGFPDLLDAHADSFRCDVSVTVASVPQAGVDLV
jgi:hypothetical protein